MVDRAQQQAVFRLVGSTMCMPLDVCRFERQGCTTKASIEAAHRAALLVEANERFAELGRTRAACRRVDDPGHPNGVEQVFMHRGWKVFIEDPGCDSIDDRGIVGKRAKDVFCKAAGGTCFSKYRRWDIARSHAVAAEFDRALALRDIPEGPIVLEAPERVLEVDRLAAVAEVNKQLGKSLVNLLVRLLPRLATLHCSERPEQKQRLVRRAAIPLLPDFNVEEGAKELVHLGMLHTEDQAPGAHDWNPHLSREHPHLPASPPALRPIRDRVASIPA